jgi:hypothetical protein
MGATLGSATAPRPLSEETKIFFDYFLKSPNQTPLFPTLQTKAFKKEIPPT